MLRRLCNRDCTGAQESTWAEASLKQSKAEYEKLLKAHDWTHQWSDDGRVYARGRGERTVLEELRPHFDQDFTLWNCYAPSDMKRKPE